MQDNKRHKYINKVSANNIKDSTMCPCQSGILGWKYVMGGNKNLMICDDSQRDRENLIELLKSYAKEKEQKNA